MHIRLIQYALICLSVFTAQLCYAAAFGSFTAEYRIRHGSLTVGKATVSFKLTKDGGYAYTSNSEPTGLTALFVKDRAQESSVGLIANGDLQPQRYQYERKQKSKNKRVDIRFDWKANKIFDAVSNKAWPSALTPGTLDRHAVQIMLMQELTRGKKAFSYSIADDHEIKRWDFVVKGKDSIVTPAGRFDTLIVKRVHSNKNRATEMWCAPALGNLPVMVEHQKGGDTEFYMELVRVTGKPILTTPTSK